MGVFMKTNFWRVTPSLLACCLVPASLCRAADEPAGAPAIATTAPEKIDQVELRLRLKQGEAYGLRSISEQKIIQTVNGQKVNVMQIIGFDMRYDVLKVDEAGNMTVKFTYTGATFLINGPMGNIEYDSTLPNDKVPDPVKGIASMIGQSLQLTMSPTGRVLDVQGVEAMMDKMSKAIDIPDANLREAIQSQMKAQFNAESIKKMTESSAAVYPGKPVAIGESWNRDAAVAGMGGPSMAMQSTYTLKERRDGIAFIEMVAKMGSGDNPPTVKMGMLDVKNELTGEMKSSLEVDEATGWIRNSDGRAEASGKVTTVVHRPAANGGDMTIEAPIAINSRTRLSSIAPGTVPAATRAAQVPTAQTQKGKTMTQDNGLIKKIWSKAPVPKLKLDSA
jgi:hypothetical protein